MNFSRKTVFIVVLCIHNFINAKTSGATSAYPIIPPSHPTPAMQQPISTPVNSLQPIEQPQSYAQALTIIKTQMSPHDVLVNNGFTQKFIDFVTSLHLSDIETKALLEAGTDIHLLWTDSNELNQRIISSLKNSIQSIVPNVRQQPAEQPKSYAQALTIIKTQMTSPDVLVNNSFTQKFIEFVKSLNLSSVEEKALFEAGANLYALWSDNDTINNNIISSLKNNIQAIVPASFITPTPVIKPTKPIQPVVPEASINPKMPSKPIQVAQPKLVKEMKDHLAVNNAIVILNPSESESIEAGAMFLHLLVGLYQHAAPMIVTSNLLEILITVKQQIGDNNLKNLRTVPGNQVSSLAEQLLKSHAIENTKDSRYLEIIGHIDFDDNNINCYFHTSEKLVLLIPKKYILSELPNSTKLNLNEQAQACGFNPDILKALPHITNENILKELKIQESRESSRENFIPNLTSLFMIQKQHKELIVPQQDIKWVIYLTGHGNAAQSIGAVRQQLEEDQKDLIFWQKSMNFWQTLTNPDSKALEASDHTRKCLAIAESRIEEDKKVLTGKASLANSQILPETAQIAGIPADGFIQLIKFFDRSLNMAYLHYSTCFAGGLNQSFVNETLSLCNVNFIVSAEGVSEMSTGIALHQAIHNKEPRVQFDESYSEFFKRLNLFITDPEKFVELKEKKEDPIKSILRTIISPGAANQPFIRFPATETFQGIAHTTTTTFQGITRTTKTKVITQTMLKTHEIENKPIKTTSENNIIIIYPKRINVPLDLLFGYKRMLFPSPKNIIAGYEDIHTFKQINYDNRLALFLFNLIELNARIYTQTFIIRNLADTDYKTSQPPIIPKPTKMIHNLIVQMQPLFGTKPLLELLGAQAPVVQSSLLTPDTVGSGKLAINLQIAFEYNNYIYQGICGIRSFETRDLWSDDFEKKLTLTSTPQASTNMNVLAKNFLTPQEIAQLTQPITLESIANFIDKKISKQDQSTAMWSEADNAELLKSIEKKAKKQKENKDLP